VKGYCPVLSTRYFVSNRKIRFSCCLQQDNQTRHTPQHTHNTTNDEQTTTLTQEKTLKRLLKRLTSKYSHYHLNPDGFIKCVTYLTINGDNTLLDEKLEQLRRIDAINKAASGIEKYSYT